MAKITTNRSNVEVGGLLRDLAIDASISGAQITNSGVNNTYHVDDDKLKPDVANKILLAPDTIIEDYKVKTYVKVSSLDSSLDESLPRSVGSDDETQLTYSEVNDRPTVSLFKRSDGNYYCEATCHIGFIGLTLDEYNNCVLAGLDLYSIDDIPDIDTEEVE